MGSLGPSWGHLGAVLGGLGLGAEQKILGQIWGRFLANFEPNLSPILVSFLGTSLSRFGDRFWANFGRILGFGVEDEVKTGINVKTWLFQIQCKKHYVTTESTFGGSNGVAVELT